MFVLQWYLYIYVEGIREIIKVYVDYQPLLGMPLSDNRLPYNLKF